jgi:hypothetical protein
MTDQLNGDWFVRQATGEGVLDDELARTAAAAVLRHNSRRSGREGWLANASWPAGGGVELPRQGSDQVSCPWSGVEYAFAAELALLGMREEARRVARDVFMRYEAAGMRFDHVECGEFYCRAMSAWALYSAEFGIAWNALDGELRVAPPEGDQRFVVAVPGALAGATWREDARELALEVLSGRLALTRLLVRGREAEVAPPRGRVVLAGGDALRARVPPAR